MKMKNLKLSKNFTFIICVLLCISLLGVSLMIVAQKNTAVFDKVAIEREIVLNKENVDVQSMLGSFNDVVSSQDEDTLKFEGSKKIDASLLDEIDNLSETDVEKLSDVDVRYSFSYNSETNVVTLSAEMQMPDGEVKVDTIEGIGFINDKNEIDAVMNVEGEGILLSEMQSAGMIENCGWFSNLIKKIAKFVVIVAVAVVAVVAVVATAGAAAPAVIASAIGLSTTVVVAAAANAAAICTYAALTAAIAAGVYITAAMVENIDWDGVSYKMQDFKTVASQLVKGFYYLAFATSDGAMLVSPVRLPTVAVAAAAFNAGYSIYTLDPVEALAATTIAGGGISGYTEGKVHGNGYFMHYHRWDHKPAKSHAFWGLPVFY